MPKMSELSYGPKGNHPVGIRCNIQTFVFVNLFKMVG